MDVYILLTKCHFVGITMNRGNIEQRVHKELFTIIHVVAVGKAGLHLFLV